MQIAFTCVNELVENVIIIYYSGIKQINNCCYPNWPKTGKVPSSIWYKVRQWQKKGYMSFHTVYVNFWFQLYVVYWLQIEPHTWTNLTEILGDHLFFGFNCNCQLSCTFAGIRLRNVTENYSSQGKLLNWRTVVRC